ncbi:proheparin-binding EGF-like growth factor isoform X1 [Oryzias latipes]|uniref:Amphiregulin n=1 Tax=Oryzias latipes TaxID=8090 RepID=H2L8M1_ORYLA|nr:proheparin-binding EGF-like growth factor isoform X1 [Oryzias latipes]XP_020561385.1 proheparin-binding EGF-like growth factor isoform X1 [Oryzias latipes]
MNPLIFICLLCIVVCSTQGAPESEVTQASGLAAVTGGPASEEGLLVEDDEHELDEELSGGHHENVIILAGVHSGKDDKRKRKGKGKRKNKQRNKNTTPLNPRHYNTTRVHTSAHSTTEDACASTHLGYCIHGFCQHIEGLKEPVCVCLKGYEGLRCEIQYLGVGTPDYQTYNSELVQTVLVVIAVVLSVISCCAILLMTCAHYRSHKNFLASYLGTVSETDKLQKPTSDVV